MVLELDPKWNYTCKTSVPVGFPTLWVGHAFGPGENNMLRRLIVTFSLAAILGLSFAGSAKADGLDTFTFTIDGNTYVWQLAPAPTPDVFFNGVLTEFDNLSYQLNEMTQPPAILDFLPGGMGSGGFQLSTGTNSIILDESGDQIYGGSEQFPTFSPGMFTLNDSAGGTGTLTITAASVPEPGTLVLIGVGMVALFGIARKKLNS